MTQDSPAGTVPALATPQERNAAMDRAFDFRGDVKLTLTDGRTVEGYVYDRKSDTDKPLVRVIPADGSARMNIPYDQIKAIAFSERDPAAGKSWDTWIRKYVEKKRKGESTDLHPEEEIDD
ncbi:MAG: hypothetical protein GC164_11930 [Phycisphaera sp.]|nr:hypothetical protein [Phycisphaera sp.]